MQKKLRTLAEAGAKSGSLDFALYRKLSLQWEITGLLATLTPLGALFLMVAKR